MRSWHHIFALGLIGLASTAKADPPTDEVYRELGLPTPSALPASIPAVLHASLDSNREIDADAKANPKKYPLRQAVAQAVRVVRKAQQKEIVHRLGGTYDERKQLVRAHQEEVARTILELEDALAMLEDAQAKNAAAKEEAQEPSKRWLAHADYLRAELGLLLGFWHEYGKALGTVLIDGLPELKRDNGENGWELRRVERIYSTKNIRDIVQRAKEGFAVVAERYPNSPWAKLAKEGKDAYVGLLWVSKAFDKPAPMKGEARSTSNIPDAFPNVFCPALGHSVLFWSEAAPEQPADGVYRELGLPVPDGARGALAKEYEPDAVTAADVKANPEKYAYRIAVLNAVAVVNKPRASNLPKLRFRGVSDEVKKLVRTEQEVPASVILDLEEAMAELEKVTALAKQEPSKRWRAHGEFMLAELKQNVAFWHEYDLLLGEIVGEDLPKFDEVKGQNGYELVRAAKMRSQKEVRELADSASELFAEVEKRYPDTPWAKLAKERQKTLLGLRWQAAVIPKESK